MSDPDHHADPEQAPIGAALRRGWTTGACAAGASRAALEALLGLEPVDPVPVQLPGGQRPLFALARWERCGDEGRAAIVKDAGDDPDVTHGALVEVAMRPAAPGAGLLFRAGPGVGTVTLPGLPLAPGEPAINPGPRRMIRAALAEVAEPLGLPLDYEVTIGIADGERIAERTMNARLGIVGGLSVLGTTGIVVPYSCGAWISTIHRGIDVAIAAGLDHVAGATGATSEAAVRALYGLPDQALIDMGDFVGGMLKYLRRHPVPRVTVAGGFAKMCKLGQGLLDLHSKRDAVDFGWLAGAVAKAGGSAASILAARNANTALQVLERARADHIPLADTVANAALQTARAALPRSEVTLGIAVFDREGACLAQAIDTGAAPSTM